MYIIGKFLNKTKWKYRSGDLIADKSKLWWIGRIPNVLNYITSKLYAFFMQYSSHVCIIYEQLGMRASTTSERTK